ncbi:hypothetical protein [Motilibacter deserti]|uniref:Uncharacterized protein n=1 Tax=Motilibacter deserti TaxID=2714956 RepID=A0ABX0H2P4_9ACTN|nr:hypothetical protein [Motilibacter deserti]NHC16064.1 hypothetical protein [Motilibacter deserti]
MPFYGGGRPGDDVTSIQQFCGGNVVLVTTSDGITRVFADDGGGNAPELSTSDCALIGAALVALGQAQP